MDLATGRKERLARLLDLAQAYRGWTRKELARRLRRDPTKLIPGSGLPKLDLVVDLAKVLDWPVDMVVDMLWSSDPDDGLEGSATRDHELGTSFTELDDAAKKAHREGRYQDMIDLARDAYRVATTSEERAKASNREAGGWDGLGRYAEMVEAVQRGLRLPGVSTDTRLMLQVNLAGGHYTLWQLVEAKATSRDLFEHFETHPPRNRLHEVVHAFSYYVRGNSFRRIIELEGERPEHFAALAEVDLQRARDMYRALAEKYDDASYLGVANTCHGALLEARVMLGTADIDQVMEEFSQGLDGLVDVSEYPVGDMLESYGWWCIFACNTALRHITDERVLQQHMAIFTNKADEIAEAMDNWSMRERVFTMEYARRQRLEGWTGLENDWLIDHNDIRVIAGTMGRFPGFHRTGWRILQRAQVLRNN